MIPLGVLGSAHVPAPAGGGGSITFLDADITADPTTAAATMTAVGLDFGTAAADRVLIAAIGTRVASGRSLSGVTIGGIAATIDRVTSTWPSAIIARASVPTGTSGDVTITLSASEAGPRMVALYVAYGTVTVNGTAQHYSASNTTSSASLAHDAGDSLVAVVASSRDSASFTWGGSLVEDYHGTLSGSSVSTSATHANSLGTGPSTVSAVSSSALYQGLAAVSYTIS